MTSDADTCCRRTTRALAMLLHELERQPIFGETPALRDATHIARSVLRERPHA